LLFLNAQVGQIEKIDAAADVESSVVADDTDFVGGVVGFGQCNYSLDFCPQLFAAETSPAVQYH
jgi:hypothetical protein